MRLACMREKNTKDTIFATPPPLNSSPHRRREIEAAQAGAASELAVRSTAENPLRNPLVTLLGEDAITKAKADVASTTAKTANQILEVIQNGSAGSGDKLFESNWHKRAKLCERETEIDTDCHRQWSREVCVYLRYGLYTVSSAWISSTGVGR